VQQSLTIPQALKNIAQMKSQQERVFLARKMQEGANKNDTWNFRQGIMNYLEVETYIHKFTEIHSKKQLQLMLSVDEINKQTNIMRFENLD